MGHKVHVVTYHLGTDRKTRGITIHRIPKIFSYKYFDPGPTRTKLGLLDPLLAIKLLSVVKKIRIDLIHAHHFEGALVSYFVSKLTRHKVIYDAHTTLEGELYAYNFINPPFIRRKIDYYVPKWADHILAVSNEIKQSLLKMGIDKRNISYVPTGVNSQIFEKKDPTIIRKKYNINTEKIIIYTGTLAEYQGIDYLLKAIKMVKEKNKDFFLFMVGNTNTKKYKRMCKDLKIDERVVFTGERQFKEIPFFLAASDVAVIPRHNCPGIPQKLTNYMSAGKAIVCFEGSGKAIRHGENGLLIGNKDIVSMSQAIIRLLEDDKLREKISMNAKKSIKGNYDWESLCLKITDIYNSLK